MTMRKKRVKLLQNPEATKEEVDIDMDELHIAM